MSSDHITQQSDAEPLKVCFVVDNLPPVYSGAGQQAVTLARALRTLGHDTVLIGKTQRGLPAHANVDGLDIFRVEAGSGGYSAARSMAEALRLLVKLIKVRSRYDVVLFFDPEGGFRNCWVILPILHAFGKKTAARMTLLHSTDPLALRRRRLGSIRLIPYRMHHGIISISSALTSSYRAVFGSNGKLSVIPNGVDVERFRPATVLDRSRIRQELGLRNDVPYACCVGRISYRKGVDIILAAWRHVVASCPDAVLLLVGPTADDYRGVSERAFVDSLKEKIRSDGIEANVQWIGAAQRVERYLRAADVFVFASRREGCPNALLEAMACGLPIVTTRLDGVTDDLISSGIHGLVTEADAAALGAGILHVLRSTDEARKIGDSARERVLAHHSIAATAQRYLHALAQL